MLVGRGGEGALWAAIVFNWGITGLLLHQTWILQGVILIDLAVSMTQWGVGLQVPAHVDLKCFLRALVRLTDLHLTHRFGYIDRVTHMADNNLRITSCFMRAVNQWLVIVLAGSPAATDTLNPFLEATDLHVTQSPVMHHPMLIRALRLR